MTSPVAAGGRGNSRRVPTILRASLAVHGVSTGVLVAAPNLWPWAVGAIAVNHLAITYGTLRPQSGLLGASLVRLDGAHPGQVCLTFDDGPDPEVTPKVLDVLDRYGAKATFFCIGRRVDAYPEVAALAVSRGHLVENHSHSHRHTFAFSGPRALTEEVERAQDAIERATGERPAYFRAPAGIRNLWLERCLDRAGLRLVSWTKRGFDTFTRRAETVIGRLQRAQAGDVLLLHDGNSARTRGGRAVVLEALPRLLENLEARSLRGVALPRNLPARGLSPTPLTRPSI